MANKAKKFLLLLLVLVLCMSAAAAQAAAFEKDGIKVDLSTDKSGYEENETVYVTLKIANTNDFDVAPVSVEYTLPDNLLPAKGGSRTVQIDVLRAGETKFVELELNVREMQNAGIPANLPTTGDDSHLVLWAVLAAASLFAFTRVSRQTRKQLFSIMLCLSMMVSLLPLGVSTALAEEAAISLNSVGQTDKRIPPVLTDAIANADVTEETFTDPAELNEKAVSDDFEESEPFGGEEILPFEEDVKRSLALGNAADADVQPKKEEAAKSISEDETGISGSINVAKSLTVMGRTANVSVSIKYGRGSVAYSYAMYKTLSQDPLWYTRTSYTKDKFEKKIGSSLPQSAHDYKPYTDEVYRLLGGSSCYGITLHFDGLTNFESNYDGLFIYNGNEEFLAKYTGTSLRNQTLTISAKDSSLTSGTNGVILRLVTDGSVGMYGFKVTGAVAHTMPEIKTCKIVNGNGHVTLTWKKLPGYTGYAIERAVVDSNGNPGTYSIIGEYGNSKATSFTDTSTVRGKTYAYRLRQVYDGYDGYYYRGPVASHPFIITIPGVLPAPENVSVFSASASKVQISWDKVPGATGYEIYSSKNLYSGYKKVKQITNGDNFATISAPASGNLSYYYVRPFVKIDKYFFYGNNSVVEPNFALGVPTNVKGQQLTYDSYRVSWKAVPNAQLYGLYISLDDGNNYYPLYNSEDEWIFTSGMSMDLTGVSGLSNDAYFAVSALRVDGDCVSESMLSKAVVYAQPKYRAFLVGNTYPGTNSALQGPDNDINSVGLMLNRQSGTPFTVTKKLNATAADMINGIQTAFAGADSSDVSLFYYSGHGLLSNDAQRLGALCGTSAGSGANDAYVTFDELRKALDKVPGKKIVMLDSCHSGAHIGKASGGEDFYLDAFNESAINAFAEPEAKANLAANNYIVITAARKTESSYTWPPYSSTRKYGLFTKYLNKSSGFDVVNWANCDWNGDSNRDGAVTLSEAYNYIKQGVNAEIAPYGVKQSTQYYGPTSTVLWKRY